ncbi:SDR family NAD(P)-dependent oxidoreductase [Kitasatospora sp. DSM 101779]|uniref:Short-chain dehydrogenase/reductase SDR n=1 Tax=Kitasatospora sp. 152608 TaxID=1769566 RepID=A0A0U3BH47_9ACTN|nr:SDR family oxidoreductase [Kitasatospora sp. DSM 101779]ALT05961.1 short-chain dehydrogenase/reductase SDR [Kitasatospora sp. 152608]MCU7825053.1 SDR family oxidoreductase [Kitasatospora sp. DSM 101779]
MAPVAIVADGNQESSSAFAMRLAELGWDVAVLCRDSTAGTETVNRVRGTGRQALAVETDVTDSVSVDAALGRVCAELGEPNVLVNTVTTTVRGPLSRISDDDWLAATGLPLRGLFVTSRSVIDPMIRQGWGRIINIAALPASVASGPHHHATVLAAVEGFTRTIALELQAFGITVNAIAPATPAAEVRTGAGPHVTDAAGPRYAAQIAAAVPFLVSDGASSVTGQVIHVGDEEAA